MNMKSLISATALCVAGLLVCPASAQTDKPARPGGPKTAARPAKKGFPCQADIEQFCKDTPTGEGAIRNCLKEHEAELSQPCQEQRQKAAERFQKVVDKAKETCQADIDKLCKGVEPGEGRVVKCLKGHAEELSPACKIVYDRVDIQIQKRKIRKEKAGK